jgi:hypothetical protein
LHQLLVKGSHMSSQEAPHNGPSHKSSLQQVVG